MFFNRSGVASLIQTTRVSDIYPIIHKYSLSYAENETTKGEIYRQMMPLRRIHVDRLATLLPNAPADSNPTLTPTQAIAGNDDLTWARVQQDLSFDWYLRAYPNGRHANEARRALARKDELLKQRDAQLEVVERDLQAATNRVFQAYVRGDKATFGSYLSSRFAGRSLRIAELKPQPDVASFEITDFEAKPYYSDGQTYRATMSVRYTSIFNAIRNYPYSILYLRTDHGWEILEWR
jgi:hypothetical protein